MVMCFSEEKLKIIEKFIRTWPTLLTKKMNSDDTNFPHLASRPASSERLVVQKSLES